MVKTQTRGNIRILNAFLYHIYVPHSRILAINARGTKVDRWGNFVLTSIGLGTSRLGLGMPVVSGFF